LIGGAMGTVATFKSLGRLLRLAGWGTRWAVRCVGAAPRKSPSCGAFGL